MSNMALLPCEVAAKSIIPSIRAAVAKILVEEYGLPRYKVAKLLNMTPAAITNYLEGRRGSRYLEKILRDERLLSFVRKLSERVLEEARGGRVSQREIQYYVCTICSSVNPAIEDREEHLRQALSTGPGRGLA